MIGVGNDLRGDDAAGLEVARHVEERLRGEPSISVRGYDGEAIGLLDLWSGSEAVVLVDAVRSGAPAGTVHRFDAGEEAVPTIFHHASSHAIGVGETIELGRALGRLPDRVILFGLEGERFAAGAELSEAVARALTPLSVQVADEALALGRSLPSELPGPVRSPRLP